MSETTLDALLSRLNSQDGQPNVKSIANALTAVAKREEGLNVLRSNLQNDPLQTIPPAAMTLQYLFIMFVSRHHLRYSTDSIRLTHGASHLEPRA